MLQFEPFTGSMAEWERMLVGYPDHQIFQTPAWLAFVAESHGAEPVLAVLKDGRETVGCFAGLTARKYGIRILGSPCPGWTTSYMGIRLAEGVSRRAAVEALVRFAFEDLGCVHLELRDRELVREEVDGLGFETTRTWGYEVDLGGSDDELLQRVSKACRRDIRRAERNGVVVEQAHDEAFADEYYNQLAHVFACQGLVPTYDRRCVQLLVRHLLPTGMLLLVRARNPEGKCIATGIFPAANTTAYFWGGASWHAHRKLLPNEAIQWYAMRYWKNRGIQRYDMVGGGEYKRKYGGREISVFWFRKSKYRVLMTARAVAKRLFGARQRLLGWWASRGGSES